VRELAMQALSSVEGGYDLLAPKFDYTAFRTPDAVLAATAGALRPLGPFGRGLDVCCGTARACGPVLFAGVRRALRPGRVFAFPVGAPQPVTSGEYWALLGFDLAMRVRNAVWRPRSSCPTAPARCTRSATT
jgi:hypothetical protein